MTLLQLQRRGLLKYIATACALGIVLFFWRSHLYDHDNTHDELLVVPDSKVHGGLSKTFVVASMARDDSKWLDTHFSDWDIKRYIVDDHASLFTVPKNKGREAMVYLT